MNDQPSTRIHEEEREPLLFILIEKDDKIKPYRVHNPFNPERKSFYLGMSSPLSDNGGLKQIIEKLSDQTSLFGAYSKLSIYYVGKRLGQVLNEHTRMRIGEYEITPMPKNVRDIFSL